MTASISSGVALTPVGAAPVIDEPTACSRDPHAFDIPGDHDQAVTVMLGRLCTACPVLQTCGEWALTHDVAGFVAGMTERERRRLRRAAVA